MYDCSGAYYSPIVFAFNANMDTLWTRDLPSDRSIFSKKLIPGDKNGLRLLSQLDYVFQAPEYVVEDVNSTGTIQHARHLIPVQDEDGADKQKYSAEETFSQSTYLSTDDNGLLITGSSIRYTYNDDGNPPATENTLYISKLTPDLTPCNNLSESVPTDGKSLGFSYESADEMMKAEEASDNTDYTAAT